MRRSHTSSWTADAQALCNEAPMNPVRTTGIVQLRCWRKAWPILALASLPSGAAQHLPFGLYDLTIETSMPHLEENLRYTITREQRCMRHEELAGVFPVLS